MSALHIHAPAPTHFARRVMRCPTCKVRRRVVVRGYEWYEPSATCCACGTWWAGGRAHKGYRFEREHRAKMARAAWKAGT